MNHDNMLFLRVAEVFPPVKLSQQAHRHFFENCFIREMRKGADLAGRVGGRHL